MSHSFDGLERRRYESHTTYVTQPERPEVLGPRTLQERGGRSEERGGREEEEGERKEGRQERKGEKRKKEEERGREEEKDEGEG